MSIITNALDIAYEVHDKQTRDNGVEPYINHCERVAKLIYSHFSMFATDENIATAILHDTLEDTPSGNVINVYKDIYNLCSPKIAGNVDILTKDSSVRDFRNKRYLAKISAAPQNVIIVKLADRIDNLNSIPQANWDIKKILNYIDTSIVIHDIAIQSGLSAQAQQLLTAIMLVEAHINSLDYR